MIDDGDCDVGEPIPVDDEHLGPNGIIKPPAGQGRPNGLIAVIPVVRIVFQLKKSLKSRLIAAPTLQTYEEHFHSIMASYPPPIQVGSNAIFKTSDLLWAFPLQSIQLFLYRHNLSPTCRRAERIDAIDRCVRVGKDTAHYIRRVMQGAQQSQPPVSWTAQLRALAPAFFCLHLWRCVLFLAFRGEYGAALSCVAAQSAIGDSRRVNIACGRNLAFFLDRIVERVSAGQHSRQAMDNDEEMLAYVSADMQGAADRAWAWTGSETGANLQAKMMEDLGRDQQQGVNGVRDHLTPTSASGPMALLTEREEGEWGGWERLENVLQQLERQQGQSPRPQGQQAQSLPESPFPPMQQAPPQQAPPQQGQPQAQPYYGNRLDPGLHGQGQQMPPPTSPLNGQSTPGPQPAPAPTNRISIQDII